MATMHQLSNMLASFDESYTNFTNVKSAQNEVSNAINDATNQLDSAINGYTVAANDEQNNNIIAGVTLVKNACTALKSHIDGDISSLLSHGAEVKETIDEIKTRIKQGEGLEEKKLKQKADLANGIKDDVYEENQQVIKLNKEIDILNEKGEAQLQAMSNAINGVAFGIKGNMKKGGALGVSVNYGDNYKFNPADYALPQDNGEQNPSEENPVGATKQLNILQGLGCGVVGAVESVGKVAEGIVDFGGTIVSGVSSLLGTVTGWLGWNGGQRFFSGLSDSISGFVKNDLVGGATKGLVDLTSGLTGVTSSDYDSSGGKKVGSIVGNVVAHGALWAVPGGAILSSAAIGGNTSENSLQRGNNIFAATGLGLLSGTASLGVGKLLGAVASKYSQPISNWANTSSNIVARVYRAGATKFGAGWGSKPLGTKIGSILGSPVRGVGKVTSWLSNRNFVKNVAKPFEGIDKWSTFRAASVVNRKELNNYRTAVNNWDATGRKVNTNEYTAMKTEWDKLPADMKTGLNIGDQVMTPGKQDSLVKAYNTANQRNITNPTPANAAARDAAYNNLPASVKPANSGDLAYTLSDRNMLGGRYGTDLTAWDAAGRPNTGTLHDNIETSWNNLPPDMKTGLSLGDKVITPIQTDSLVSAYNTANQTSITNPTPANIAARDAAYSQLPASVKPANAGDPAFTIGQRNLLGNNYGNSLNTFNAAGSQVNTAEYTAVDTTYNALDVLVKPPVMGNAAGTFNQSQALQRTGGIISGLIDDVANK